jgi:hypothetical protein
MYCGFWTISKIEHHSNIQGAHPPPLHNLLALAHPLVQNFLRTLDLDRPMDREEGDQ